MEITWTFSDWIPVGEIVVQSGRMWLGDAQFAPIEDDGLVVELPTGTYAVAVRQIVFNDGEVRNSRLRVCPSGPEPEKGTEIGRTWADTASQAACDFVVYKSTIPATYDEYWERAEGPLTSSGAFGIFHYDEAKGATLAFCESGWGDGDFAVRELLRDGVRVGVEIEMMNEDDPLPDW